MDIVQLIHQSGYLIKILEGCGSDVTGLRVQNFNGGAPGSQMHPIISQGKIIFGILPAKNDFFRRLGHLFNNHLPGKGDVFSVAVNDSTIVCKHLNSIFKPLFIGHPCFFKNPQSSGMQSLYLFR